MFIGYGSIILPNVRIGNKVIVGAGTVVSKDIPDNVVVVGPNAKLLAHMMITWIRIEIE